MKLLFPLAIAAGAAVAGCAATSEEPRVRGAGECKADAAQSLIGQKATADVGSELLRRTGARVIRWVPPRTAVTMDFRADRLTVSYDDDMVITTISCT